MDTKQKSKTELVGYIRVSETGDRTEERFKSPDLQRAAIEQWAKTRYPDGYTFLDFFEDIDQTGTSMIRPGLQRAQELAISVQATIVVVDISRWARDLSGMDEIERLGRLGVAIESVREPLDFSTAEGTMSASMFLVFAKYYADKVSAGWRQTIGHNKDLGLWHGVVPIGYRRPSDAEAAVFGKRSGVILIDEVGAAVVRDAFRRFLAGETFYAINKTAKAAGHWRHDGQAKKVLTNPVYAGWIVKADSAPNVKQDGTYQVDQNGRKVRRRVAGSETLIRGVHEALVSQSDFDEVQRLVAKQQKAAVRKSETAPWSGAGLAFCASCGRRLVFERKSSGRGRYLRCRTFDANRCDWAGGVDAEDVEQLLDEAIPLLGERIRTDARKHLERIMGAKSGEECVVKDVKAKLAKIEAEIQRWTSKVMASGDEVLVDGLPIENVRAEMKRPGNEDCSTL